jgi:hypothetical protein
MNIRYIRINKNYKISLEQITCKSVIHVPMHHARLIGTLSVQAKLKVFSTFDVLPTVQLNFILERIWFLLCVL